MPESNIEFGTYGARGVRGHEAVARQLDALADFIATPITAWRGLLARLHYLTRSDHARRAARDAGLTVTDRTLKAWIDGRRSPSRQNLERGETAYRTARRPNVVRCLLARPNREGRGTRVEFRPLTSPRPTGPDSARCSTERSMSAAGRIVEAWANDDPEALDDAWVSDVAVDLGSEWGQYEYVTNVGSRPDGPGLHAVSSAVRVRCGWMSVTTVQGGGTGWSRPYP